MKHVVSLGIANVSTMDIYGLGASLMSAYTVHWLTASYAYMLLAYM